MTRTLRNYGPVFVILIALAFAGVAAYGPFGVVVPITILVTATSLAKVHSGRWFP